MKIWEVTGRTKSSDGIVLHQIRATTDCTLKCGIKIKKGEIGGWIEKEENLGDNAWVADDACVYGNAKVYDDACVYGNAHVYGNAVVHDNARIHDYARVYNNVYVHNNARIHGNARVFGSAEVYGDALVYGNAEVYGTVSVFGIAEVYGSARVYGNARIGGDAQVQKLGDVIWFKNIWSSGRVFTYTKSNNKWRAGCFYGSGEELIKEAYSDSEISGKCYEATVEYVKKIYSILEQ